MKKNKNTLFDKLFMSLLGIILMSTGFNALQIENNKIDYMEANGKPAEATIVKFVRDTGKKRRTRPVIAYEFEGEEYKRTMNHYSFLMNKGDIVEILVDPDNPDSFIDTSSDSIALYVVIFIGAALPVSVFLPDVVRNFRGE